MIKMNRWKFSLIGLGLVAALILVTPRAVHAVAAALVQVMNTTANPVIASNMDDPGRIPYEKRSNPSTCIPGECFFDFVVPANHRLVIQHASVSGEANGPGVALLDLSSANGGSTSFAPSGLTGAQYSFEVDEPVLQFVDGGGFIQAALFFYGGSATLLGANFTLSGYLLDCAAAPCSAIAN